MHKTNKDRYKKELHNKGAVTQYIPIIDNYLYNRIYNSYPGNLDLSGAIKSNQRHAVPASPWKRE